MVHFDQGVNPENHDPFLELEKALTTENEIGPLYAFGEKHDEVWPPNVVRLKRPNGSTTIASNFILQFFAARTQGMVCIAAYPNEKGKGTSRPEIYTRDAAEIEEYLKANDKTGWAVYFGVNPIIEGKRRNKENVAAITVLHSDVDFKGVVEEPHVILRVLKSLPLKPTFIVFSGHGVHLYWLLKQAMPVEEKDRVEACLKEIARVLAGDLAVAEIARIMRLPGSHNTKDGDNIEVRNITGDFYLPGMRGHEYSFKDLEKWFRDAEPMLTRVKPVEKEQKTTHGNGHDADAPDYNPWEKYEVDIKEPLDPDVELGLMQYHDSTGHGVDLTQYRCIGHYVHDGVLIDEAVNYVVDKTFELIPEAASWSRSQEIHKVRNMAVRTYVNHPEQLEKQSQLPKWLENDARIKKLLEAPRVELKPETKLAELKHTNKPIVDFWKTLEPPPLPKGLLPKVIEDFAFKKAELMGCDPAGLAMSGLTVCGAAISDRIKIQPKTHDPKWKESARLWVGHCGLPSAMKSPLMDECTERYHAIDNILIDEYKKYLADWEALDDKQKKTSPKPKQKRIRIEDTTTEALQSIMENSVDGLLLVRDELSGWFGIMDKYSGSRGGSYDRGFWLQTYKGGAYTFDRVKRGSVHVENCGVSVLGGIQDDTLRTFVNEGIDDGLIQRMLLIMLRPAVLGKKGIVVPSDYDDLIDKLRLWRTDDTAFNTHCFDDEAEAIRYELEREHIELQAAYMSINKKLATHIGKYNGIFARLCLIWHCIENADDSYSGDIDANIARRVAKFLHEFLLPHAKAFYLGVLGRSDQHDTLTDVAGYILARKMTSIGPRDVQRGTRKMRGLERTDINRIFEQLEACNWLIRAPSKNYSDVTWRVNPDVHKFFADKAEEERERREREKAMIATSLATRGGDETDV